MQKGRTSDVLELHIHYITSILGIDPNDHSVDFAEDNGFEKLVITCNKATVGKISERSIYEETGFTLSLSEFEYVITTLTFTRPLVKDPLA